MSVVLSTIRSRCFQRSNGLFLALRFCLFPCPGGSACDGSFPRVCVGVLLFLCVLVLVAAFSGSCVLFLPVLFSNHLCICFFNKTVSDTTNRSLCSNGADRTTA